jgi:hypothetical protein
VEMTEQTCRTGFSDVMMHSIAHFTALPHEVAMRGCEVHWSSYMDR